MKTAMTIRPVRRYWCGQPGRGWHGLWLGLLAWTGAYAADSLCASVKIEIQQEVTLEREAFDAMMRINNGFTELPLTDVGITVNFQDADGNPVTATTDGANTNALFFIREDSRVNLESTVDGTVEPGETAEIHWLIIPSPGAGGSNVLGQVYFVGADLTYKLRDQVTTMAVVPDRITVQPMPLLRLDYFLPGAVYGDDPFTAPIEAPVPFSLGLRVKNDGYGPARALKVESAQPEIVQNELGLLVGFEITGSEVGAAGGTRSLLVDFGTIAAGRSGVARWIMTASLVGEFTKFEAAFTHADELGGELTSLLKEVRTHTLVHDVLVDLPGRDAIRDFLAADTNVLTVYESESQDTAVTNLSAAAGFAQTGASGDEIQYTLTLPAAAGPLYAGLDFPAGTAYEVVSAVRGDGKVVPSDNRWISKSRARGTDPWQYLFNLFDSSVGGTYQVVFTRREIPEDAAPVLAYIGNQTLVEGAQLGFLVVASDPNGTLPSLAVSNLPAGAVFEDNHDGTGTFLWQTQAGDAGVYNVRFIASDGQATDEELVRIDVAGTELVVLTGSTNINVRENGEGRFFVRLNRNPGRAVVVNIARSAGETNMTVKSGASRSFKSSNWDVWQAVVLAAAADANATNETATFRISMAGAQDQFVTATVLDSDIGENLARPASGSMLAGMRAYQLAQVVDGVHTTSVNYGYTIWTNDPPGTMTLDLQRATTLSRVRLLNWDWTYRVNRYRLEASADGATWTDLAADAHETDRQGWDDWAVSGDPVRYVRFTGLSSSANQCVVLSELEVYGTPEPLPALAVSKTAVNVREAGEGRFFVRLAAAPLANVTVTVARSGGDTNLTVTGGAVRVFKPSNWDVWQAVVLAAGADANAADETAMFQVSAPGYADTVVPATALDGELGENLARAAGTTVKGWRAMQVANAVDGVHTSSASYTYTIWTNDPPGMLTVDLKSLKNLTRVRLLNWDWTYRVNRYRLEASADGVNWTDLAPTAQTTDRQGWDDWAVSAAGVRYVRFTGLYSSANQCAALSELEIYGSAPARRSSGQVKQTVAAASEPVSVLTSDGPEDETGWAAVDGDPETAWISQQAGGGYLVVEYAPALTLRALEVDLVEGSLSNANYLYSQDAEEWLPLPEGLETNPVSLNFLWLVFPESTSASAPGVFEIRPNP